MKKLNLHLRGDVLIINKKTLYKRLSLIKESHICLWEAEKVEQWERSILSFERDIKIY